ncbi:MAG: hypothetical protein ABL996_15955 [Micropepsaceae bacterium]
MKQAWQTSAAVLLGTVEFAKPNNANTLRSKMVHVRAEHAFKGVSKGGVIELQQSATDCDAKFRVGERATFCLAPDTSGMLPVLRACPVLKLGPQDGGFYEFH